MKFPTLVDSTMMADLRNCPRSFAWAHGERLTPKGAANIHLIAGAAYAAGLERYRLGIWALDEPPKVALARGISALFAAYPRAREDVDHAKNAFAIAGGLLSYTEKYPAELDPLKPHYWAPGKPAVEFTFSIPLPVDHPETGEPILYGGRFDAIVEHDSLLLGLDDKTTSRLGPSWSQQWEMRGQFTGYCWAAAEAGIRLDGFVVRGISILKGGYGHAQAIVYRPEWRIEQWLDQTIRDLERAKRAFEEGYWDMNFEHCSAYSGCPFVPLCSSQNPERWLGDYEERSWNPLFKEGRP